MENEKTVGDKINEILEIRGLKQADLHRLTGISRGHISEICGNKRPSIMLDTVRRIAKALNIHPAYFLEEDTMGPSDILPHLTEEQDCFYRLHLGRRYKGPGETNRGNATA